MPRVPRPGKEEKRKLLFHCQVQTKITVPPHNKKRGLVTCKEYRVDRQVCDYILLTFISLFPCWSDSAWAAETCMAGGKHGGALKSKLDADLTGPPGPFQWSEKCPLLFFPGWGTPTHCTNFPHYSQYIFTIYSILYSQYIQHYIHNIFNIYCE